MKKIAIDACTLIYLAKAELLEFLKKLPFRFIIDSEVYKETVSEGKKKGYVDAHLLEYYIKTQKVIKVIDVDITPEISYFVGEGEASTFILSSREGATAVTSDRVAFKKMVKRNTKVVQTDLMFFYMFLSGYITKRELLKILDRLFIAGGTTPERVSFILKKLGEQNENEKK